MKGEPKVGMKFWADLTFETAPLLLREVTLPMKVNIYEDGTKICWSTGAYFLLYMTHCYVLCPSAGSTRLWNYEYQTGVLTNLTYDIMSEPVTTGFAKYNEELVAEAAKQEASLVQNAQHPDCGEGGPLVPPGTKGDKFFANT